ncbi:MAG: methyltransferase regulatory domain-containing protein, partial [Steroidobacteraceae bacterium]
ELADTVEGTADARARGAVDSLRTLAHGKLRYFIANPEALAAVDAYFKSPPDYLAHEYLGDSWELFYSVDVAQEMAEAALSFVGSATLADNHPLLVIDDAAAEALASLRTPRQRQLAADFAANRRFRRDVFIRGPFEPMAPEHAPYLGASLVGSYTPEQLSATVRVPRGHISFQPEFIERLRALLERGPMPLAQLAIALAGQGSGAPQSEALRNLLLLLAAGALQPFANVCDSSLHARPTAFANSTVAKIAAYVIETGESRALPSRILGYGLELRPLEAVIVREFLADAPDVPTLTKRVLAVASDSPFLRDCAVSSRTALVAAAIREILPRMIRLHLIV